MTRKTTNKTTMTSKRNKPIQLPLLKDELEQRPGTLRRSFLKALGISGVAGLTACEQLSTRKLIPYLVPPEEVTPGVSTLYASTCTGCPAACGLMVTVRDGRPIKLEGHPEHPLSKGGLCALGQAEIRGLYDAGRLTEPTISGAPVSWDALDAQVRTQLVGAQGTVEVLSASITSPTARLSIERFLSRFNGSLTEYDCVPGNAVAVLDAYQSLDGRRLAPFFHFDRADLIVSLGSDFLGGGDNPVVHTSLYAARRKQGATRGALKHIQIEGNLSLTGAAADQRWLARVNERLSISMWLLKSLAQRVGALDISRALNGIKINAEPPLGDRIVRLADNLYQTRGRSIVVSGSADAAEQVAVALINRVLGNEETTVDLETPSEICHGDSNGLNQLRERLASGIVAALIVLGTDPVEQLADGERWKTWLGSVGVSVAITDRPTATAAACKVVATAHHGLESWHDFQPRRDVLSLAQPTIRPLYKTRHPLENFLVWSEAEETDYRKHLRDRWREAVYPRISGTLSFDEFWFRSVAKGSPAIPLSLTGNSADSADSADSSNAAGDGAKQPASPITIAAVLGELSRVVPAKAPDLEVELMAQVGLRDGSRSFNPWLRELPDPLSRVVWTPTIAVSPSRAKNLGVVDGDLIEVKVADKTIVMPVRVSPGQHHNVLGVPVGYGRIDGDRSVVPRNGYLLGSGPATISVTGTHEDLPLAQVHSSSEDRGHIHQVSGYAVHVPVEHDREAHSLWDNRPLNSPHWHMSINLDACTGCSACVIACQAENNIPVVGPLEVKRYRSLHWLRIDRYFVANPDSGEADNPQVLFEPMLCAQCDNAPCETVCPVAATVHSHDGLNLQVYNRCVGTRYCANNCPYKVRRFNWLEYDHGAPVERMVLNPDVVVRERGVMEKCTFCIQRIQRARIDARKNGQPSFEVKTACQQSCPADAIGFGDGTDSASQVSRDRKEPRAFQALAEIGIKPSITYLARVRNRES